MIENQAENEARRAGLEYVVDLESGIRRIKSGTSFSYTASSGKRITNSVILERIKHLVIPPAWKDVRICTSARGHIQAIGRDNRGRKQYLYHPRWRSTRDEAKYLKILELAEHLPKIHRAMRRHLALHGLPREKVLAAVVAIMERTCIRVGNEEYAHQNDSYGLTTLKDRHARINGKKVHFEFKGKSGVKHEIDLEDKQLTDIVRRCRDLPQEELFAYVDEAGVVRDVTSADINQYIRQISGDGFTTKDFRTWAGTVLAAAALCECGPFKSQAAARRNIAQSIDRVAQKLGNTRAVCRKSYIHPRVIGAYLDGTLAIPRVNHHSGNAAISIKLSREESAVLALLKRDRSGKLTPRRRD